MKSVLEKDGNVRHLQSISVRYFEGIRYLGKVYLTRVVSKLTDIPGYQQTLIRDSGLFFGGE